MKQLMLALLAGAAIAASGDAAISQTNGQPGAHASEWPTYGHDSGGMRFSPLKQITPANVANLQAAWTYHLKPEGGPGDFRATEATPLVINGIMYIASPYGQVVALDPTTRQGNLGLQIAQPAQPATRGVEYFPGDKQTPPQIVVGTSDGKLFTLDAKTGALNTKFGVDGIVDLNTPEITHGLPRASAGTVFAADHVPEPDHPRRPHCRKAAAPARRAMCAPSTSMTASWPGPSIPFRSPANPISAPGPATAASMRTGVNVWGFMTVDAKRGIVYMPFGAPSGDLFGGDRPGNDLYDSSMVAADAKTGKYLWHFQVVHHDIWDFDLETPPLLMDVKKDGKTIPAVAVFGKSSLLFLLDRATGKPIYGVTEERRCRKATCRARRLRRPSPSRSSRRRWRG